MYTLGIALLITVFMWRLYKAFAENKMDKADLETPPLEATPIETPPLEATPIETPPLEAAPVETPPLENSPLEVISSGSTPMRPYLVIDGELREIVHRRRSGNMVVCTIKPLVKGSNRSLVRVPADGEQIKWLPKR